MGPSTSGIGISSKTWNWEIHPDRTIGLFNRSMTDHIKLEFCQVERRRLALNKTKCLAFQMEKLSYAPIWSTREIWVLTITLYSPWILDNLKSSMGFDCHQQKINYHQIVKALGYLCRRGYISSFGSHGACTTRSWWARGSSSYEIDPFSLPYFGIPSLNIYLFFTWRSWRKSFHLSFRDTWN